MKIVNNVFNPFHVGFIDQQFAPDDEVMCDERSFFNKPIYFTIVKVSRYVISPHYQYR
jgi:hypothetical protein